MEKIKVSFFLDYGECIWNDCLWDKNCDDDERDVGIDYLPLKPATRRQVDEFLREYHQFYSYGCPPTPGWTVEDCRRFNREYRRILALMEPDLIDGFIICIKQLDLAEDEDFLEELERRGVDFYLEQKHREVLGNAIQKD